MSSSYQTQKVAVLLKNNINVLFRFELRPVWRLPQIVNPTLLWDTPQITVCVNGPSADIPFLMNPAAIATRAEDRNEK